MNKLLVVAKNPETYFIKRLIEEVGQEHTLHYNPWADQLPSGFDQIWFRSSGVYHSDLDLEFVRGAKVPVINPVKSLETFRSKSSQYDFFNHNGLPSLPWSWLEGWKPKEEELYLVKPDYGQGGWGIQVMKAHELIHWREAQRASGDLSWLVQPYLRALEYRVFFVGSERFTLLREPQQGHKAANFTQEGRAQLVQSPAHLREPLEALISASGALYGAIDLLDPHTGPVFLELNVVPGIQQLESIAQLNIMKKLITANYSCQKS